MYLLLASNVYYPVFMLILMWLKANNDNPEFVSTYKNTEQKLRVNFSHLEVLLHEEALLTLMSFAQNIGNKMSEISPQAPPTEDTTHRRRSSNVSDVVDFIGKQATKTGKDIWWLRHITSPIC